MADDVILRDGSSSVGPGLGALADTAPAPQRSGGGRTQDGSYRRSQGFRREFVQVTLQREKGVTPKGYLAHPFRAPTGPLETFTREGERGWDTYDTIDEGEYPSRSGKKLRRPSFTILMHDLLRDWQAWTGSHDVQRMIRELEGIKEHDVVFRLVVGQPALWGSTPLMSMLACLTNVSAESRAGEVGTEYVTLDFLQQRQQTLEVKGTRKRARDSDDARRYDLQNGDTLVKIARRKYDGDTTYAPLIRRKNGMPTSVAIASASDLAGWAKKHHKRSIVLPAALVFDVDRRG